MPIHIPNDLPARLTLEEECIPLILHERAIRQDIRPLEIAILNLMPDKISTETQLLRALGATPLQVNITLITTASYTGKHTCTSHLESFYKKWDDVKESRFDGLIITGAPVEQLNFEDVAYWHELMEIMNWADKHVFSSFFICWAAQAALYHYHGVHKVQKECKLFGLFEHKTCIPFHPLTTGFDEEFAVPVSRHTEVSRDDVLARPELEVLLESEESGLCLVAEPGKQRVYMFNHLEYDLHSLRNEYLRDKAAGLPIDVPRNYFPSDDPAQEPRINWRAHRNLLFGNWINYVYQGTPYDLVAL